ncbi:histidine-rich glycoprotein-like [Toxorhynchites rutilus septentrionalis]|uniref:histidine-rich glycoprotein-like n=1 Tax=Toxorhynchites rutilus septentrionalis TaxID=329112 RepID=UPI002479E5C9|nr:histidine-rich glycoprotein-like [Toxorhynchites rutilus septentrionalis]
MTFKQIVFQIVGVLAFVAVTSAQSGIGYYGHHLQKQHHNVEVHHEPEIHLQEQVHYAVPEVHHQAKIHLQPQVQVYHQPQVHYQPQHHEEEEHHGPAHYQFDYDIHDDHTGDVHGRKEVREGDKTEGQYYLIDADGHKRTVTYQVHGKSGFIAQVHREPIKGYQAPQQHQSHHDHY